MLMDKRISKITLVIWNLSIEMIDMIVLVHSHVFSDFFYAIHFEIAKQWVIL